MPVFNFTCPKCALRSVRLLKASEVLGGVYHCPKDGNVLEREYGLPSTISKEVIESPVWPRKVEQYTNSGDLIEEREHNADLVKSNKDL
jgi:hypothetical protein